MSDAGLRRKTKSQIIIFTSLAKMAKLTRSLLTLS